MLPAAELDRFALEQELDSLALDAATDLGEAERIRRRGQQLVVLAEAEIGHGGLGSERNPLEVDHEPAAGAARYVRGVAAETVGEVDQRVRLRGQAAALLEAQRRARVALLAKGSAGGASGPVTTSRSPGRAPPRPGTRAERPSAVTAR